MWRINDEVMTHAFFYLVTIDNATKEEEMEEDGAMHVKYTKEVDFEKGKKLCT